MQTEHIDDDDCDSEKESELVREGVRNIVSRTMMLATGNDVQGAYRGLAEGVGETLARCYCPRCEVEVMETLTSAITDAAKWVRSNLPPEASEPCARHRTQ